MIPHHTFSGRKIIAKNKEKKEFRYFTSEGQIDNIPQEKLENLLSEEINRLSEEDSQDVFGFEFSNEDANAIRYCDCAIRILIALQEKGIALIPIEYFNSEEYKSILGHLEGEYWDVFLEHNFQRSNPNTVALISNDIQQLRLI